MGLLTVQCPHCGTSREVDEKFYRREVRCPRCKRPFSVKAALSAWKRLVGQVVEGKYILRELLGEGGFALVYLADETGLEIERQVAVKLIYPDPEIPRELQARELIAVLKMSHPFIVQGFDAGLCDLGGLSWLYLVMELAEETLEMRTRRGLLPPNEAWQMTEDVVSGLAYLHKDPDRFVHRDLKPANILRFGQQWKLADFGLVYPMERMAKTMNRPVGTERYIPPEGYDGVVTPAWDMWSFGVMLAEALTGRHPFENDREMLFAVSQLDPDLPEDLPVPFSDIIRGCLIKKRSMRWTAPQVLAMLHTSRGMRASLSAYRWTFNQSLRRMQATKKGPAAGAPAQGKPADSPQGRQ